MDGYGYFSVFLSIASVICRLHEALPQRERTAHGAGAQVHPRQLDERVQEVVSHPPGRLPHR